MPVRIKEGVNFAAAVGKRRDRLGECGRILRQPTVYQNQLPSEPVLAITFAPAPPEQEDIFT